MTTLEEAWQWYLNTRHHLLLWGRMAGSHWHKLPWESLAKDEKFKGLEAKNVTGAVAQGVEHLDDLAVVVLFSLFESEVRQQILDEVDQELPKIQHRVLKVAAQDAKDQLEEGSFFRVTKPFKDRHSDLVEQVDQVRKYRNWVAHGRRSHPPSNVTPQMAYQRLLAFLAILRPNIPP